ncbi:MAG: S-adenosylmethionine:tRNA ribosyltransferase-isomerase [Acidimicrobiia bacterium]|nr:S-adenosylmethionine:tRNA ribosyltransferase-isomerase [Acidimicrobiia bacterium]
MAALAVPPLFEGFTLDAAHEAHEPPEARGVARDGVRLLVSVGTDDPVHAHFTDLPGFVGPGDLLVVNTSGTVPAALDGRLGDGEPVVVHVSTTLPGGLWLVEVRRPAAGATVPFPLEGAQTVHLVAGAGGVVDLLAPFGASRRLWVATIALVVDRRASVVDPGVGVVEPAAGVGGATAGGLADHLAHHGRPIRYAYVPQDWPIDAYQTVFAREPGSAEMPSAARPFTADLVTALVRAGVTVAPLVLHTGVSSLEGDEAPYPERYRVPPATAALVNATRGLGGRVVAVGTTVVRALETVTDAGGTTHPGDGWTELVVTPEHPVRSVDGLLTGWHEPEASHLLMLEAVAGRPALELAYRAALGAGYLWHEFGDSHLLLPASR